MQDSTQQVPRRTLSLFDAVCIIVGTIIGAGIFQTAPIIASLAGDFKMMIALWICGSVITIAGALCFAELTTRFPDLLGGDYGFLKLAFGRTVGFLFAWATFWIIRPGNMGAMAITFAVYFSKTSLFGEESAISVEVFAIAAVVILSLVNLIGLSQGKWIQNILTVAKVLGLLVIFVLGCTSSAGFDQMMQADAEGVNQNWLLAMVFIMFSFGGWNDLSFISSEIQKPKRNLFNALIFGSLLVTAIYLLVNFAFVCSLGFEGVVGSEAVATDVVRESFGSDSLLGQRGAQIIAGLICVSCLGAINGIIITSPRIYYAAGRDFRSLSFLGRWNSKRDQPWIATLLQAAVTIGLFCLCFQFEDPFSVIVVVSAPFFWTFLGLMGIVLVVLRRRFADLTEGFRTPLYPLEPSVLTLSSFAMAYASVNHMLEKGYTSAAIAVFGLMVAGVVFGLTLQAEPAADGDSEGNNSVNS